MANSLSSLANQLENTFNVTCKVVRPCGGFCTITVKGAGTNRIGIELFLNRLYPERFFYVNAYDGVIGITTAI